MVHGSSTKHQKQPTATKIGKDSIAWIFPCAQNVKKSQLYRYLSRIDNIENQIGEYLSVVVDARTPKSKASWFVPIEY